MQRPNAINPYGVKCLGVFILWASVDNFDMLQSYSVVYCGDQSRSYYSQAIVYPSAFPSTHCHRRSTSPGNSPHKLGKVGPKRIRTVCARELTKNVCAITPQNNSFESQTLEIIQSVFTHSQTALTLEDFWRVQKN